MAGHGWDPERYLTYADERGRPFVDLLQRVAATDPRTLVDLGCGPGNLTALLHDRWPRAQVIGLDSSPEMVERARRDHPGLAFDVADLRDWAGADADVSTRAGSACSGRRQEPGQVDVLVSNATLQWVPGHLDLLPSLVGRVAPGGWFAFQVPGNFDQPSHTIRAELADEERYAAHTRDVAVPGSHDPEVYLDRLTRLRCDVDAWETTYLHVLTGEDPVFTWVSGTGARPTLQALPPGLREEFEDEFRRRLRAAYPEQDHGVVLPFRRVFVVARTPEATAR